MYNQEGTTMEEQESKQSIPAHVMEIYAKSKALSVEPYTGDKDCERYITVEEAIKICETVVNKSNSGASGSYADFWRRKRKAKELWLEFGYINKDGWEDLSWYNEGRLEIRYFLWNYIKYIFSSKKQSQKYFKWRFGTKNYYLTKRAKNSA